MNKWHLSQGGSRDGYGWDDWDDWNDWNDWWRAIGESCTGPPPGAGPTIARIQHEGSPLPIVMFMHATLDSKVVTVSLFNKPPEPMREMPHYCIGFSLAP
jgi:hypothetical protein